MKILQSPISENHKSAMFFDGIIAEFDSIYGKYKLETYQTGEIIFDGMIWTGKEIIGAAKERFISDIDIENKSKTTILVDKFITITFNGSLVDDDYLMFDNYDDALTAFKALIGFE